MTKRPCLSTLKVTVPAKAAFNGTKSGVWAWMLFWERRTMAEASSSLFIGNLCRRVTYTSANKFHSDGDPPQDIQ